jgi:SAM-dependent methyltransferase
MSQARDVQYTPGFYEKIRDEGGSSAQVIVPHIIELLSPRRVLDVGCGAGTWLACFERHGVADVFGVDGSWVDQRRLEISVAKFKVVDLAGVWAAPTGFDLTICLEVGEHLPQSAALNLVLQLTSSAPAVLFSAALPGQQGTNHINEQWPEYWEEMFQSYGYERLDPIRRHVWQNANVAWYYQQNIYLYVRKSIVDASTVLNDERERVRNCRLTLVHPKIFRKPESVSRVLRSLPRLVMAAAKRRLSRRTLQQPIVD